MPESPRWLFLHDQDEKAIEVLAALKGADPNDEQTSAQAEEIRAAVILEASVQKGWLDMFKNDGVRSQHRVLLAILVQFLQPFSGSAVISYYQTVIFQSSIGMPRTEAQLMSGYLSIWFLFASFLTWVLIERVGRRPLFLIFSVAMGCAMLVLAVMVKLATHSSGIVAAVMIFLFEAFFTWGWQGNVWCYAAEIVPLECRTKAMGLATGVQWTMNFLMIYVTPIGLANIGWKMYISELIPSVTVTFGQFTDKICQFLPALILHSFLLYIFSSQKQGACHWSYWTSFSWTIRFRL